MASECDQTNIANRYTPVARHLALVALGVTLILAACVDSSNDAIVPAPDAPPVTGEPSTSVSSVPITGSATEGTAGTPGAGGVPGKGLAVTKSDVNGLSDSVLTAGEVLFIPEERAADMAGAASFDPSDIDSMRHAFFQLDGSRLAELAGAAAVIGADGRFPFDIPAGRYLVCLADSFVDHTAGPPYSVVGCDVIDLPGGASLTVSFGEGGVEAILD